MAEMDVDKKLTVLDHLRELRQRLVKSVIALVVAIMISFAFTSQIFDILISPAGDINLIYTEMTEMVGTYMKVSFASGLILVMPYLTYHAIMFVSPALTSREKKLIYVVLPWIALMFIGGVLFAYFVFIPPVTRFLVSFGSEVATPQIKIGNYISMVTRLLLATGLIFELPVVTTFLARLGVITPKWLASKRRAAILVAFVLGAIITPTFDPINQTIVAAPLIVLYEISIWLARLVQAGKKREELVSATVGGK